MKSNQTYLIRIWKNIVLIVLVLLLVVASGCTFSSKVIPEQDNNTRKENTENQLQENQLSEDKVLALMFPDRNFVQESKGFRDSEGKLYIIRDIIEGSFIKEGRKEQLAIIEITEGLSHAEGFYQAYLAVFDENAKQFLSSIKNFSADEGQITIYSGNDKSYILFAGNSTFNGWTSWAGGLWEAGENWSLRWPQDIEFWEHHSVEVEIDGLRVYERIIYPQEGQLIPEYEWKYSYYLLWDSETANFNRVNN